MPWPGIMNVNRGSRLAMADRPLPKRQQAVKGDQDGYAYLLCRTSKQSVYRNNIANSIFGISTKNKQNCGGASEQAAGIDSVNVRGIIRVRPGRQL